ncbi:MAG: hypothetical protein GY934_00485 [Gammaproteobacteria bacterium]|nr:hypothetical protein [Gammaproteobacteria bacterium]
MQFDRHWSDESNTEVWLYRVVGGGHDWPGARGNIDIHASQTAWAFSSRTITK